MDEEIQAETIQAQETDRRQEWIEVFQKWDTNNDGELCISEIKYMMRVCGTDPTDEEIIENIKEADKNDDMKFSCDEFCLFMEKQYAQGDPAEKLREAISWYDKDNSGYLDREELKEILKKCNCVEDPDDEALLDEVIASADLNGDGNIAVDEFVKKLHCVD